MSSKDFVELMNKIYKENYNILSIDTEMKGVEDGSTIKAKIALGKDNDSIVIESSEADFFFYASGLRRITNTTGECKLKHVKSSYQYNEDVCHLIDEDHSKIKQAANEIKSGKFVFTYNLQSLVDGLLSNERNLNDKKFLPLKRDYHHILAYNLMISAKMLKMYERLLLKYKEADKTFKALDAIMKSFMPSKNAIKNYKFYREYLGFDIGQLAQKISTQLKDADDTSKEFIKRGVIDADVALPRLMNTYANYLEVLKPVLNLLRIGLELGRGNDSPDRQCKCGENIRALKSDTEFGTFFSCLDEQIRHSSAHASF